MQVACPIALALRHLQMLMTAASASRAMGSITQVSNGQSSHSWCRRVRVTGHQPCFHGLASVEVSRRLGNPLLLPNVTAPPTTPKAQAAYMHSCTHQFALDNNIFQPCFMMQDKNGPSDLCFHLSSNSLTKSLPFCS